MEKLMTTVLKSRPTPGTNGSNGHVPVGIKGTRSKRVPWIALGVVLVVTGALLFGIMVQSAGHRTPVVVAARDLERGQVVESSDLRIVEVAIDGKASVVPASQRASLVGKTAASRIAAGTLVNSAQFVEGSLLGDDEVVVGALLGPGGLPVPNLRVGDDVLLLQARDTDHATGGGEPIGTATVYMVSTGTQSGSQFISLAVETRVAQKVADAAAAQLLRLVLQPGGAG
jgi:Flp pilus assembly protein CpaB